MRTRLACLGRDVITAHNRSESSQTTRGIQADTADVIGSVPAIDATLWRTIRRSPNY